MKKGSDSKVFRWIGLNKSETDPTFFIIDKRMRYTNFKYVPHYKENGKVYTEHYDIKFMIDGRDKELGFVYVPVETAKKMQQFINELHS